MTEEIRDRGFPVSKERVERLMRENGIRARHKRRYRVTTDSKHKLPVAPNLLNREFTPTEPNPLLLEPSGLRKPGRPVVRFLVSTFTTPARMTTAGAFSTACSASPGLTNLRIVDQQASLET
jgi:transposase InsO family protein